MTIGENGDKNCFENWELCLFQQFSFHDNRTVHSSHYCPSLANSGIQFFVLPSVTRECNPKILELHVEKFLTCFSVAPFTCNTHWSSSVARGGGGGSSSLPLACEVCKIARFWCFWGRFLVIKWKQPPQKKLGAEVVKYMSGLAWKSVWISDFGRKIRLNFGEDLFFFWRSPVFGLKKTSEFPILAEKFVPISVKTFFFFLEITCFWAEKTFEFPILAE